MGGPPESKSSVNEAADASEVEDAEVVHEAGEPDEAPVEATDDAAPDSTDTSDPNDPEDDAEDGVNDDIETVEDVAPAPEPAAVAAPAQRKGGMFPLILGGVVAAGLGFALARYGVPDGWPTPETDRSLELAAALEEQTARADALEAALDELANRSPDTSAVDALSGRVDQLETSQSETSARASEASDGLSAATGALADLDQRLATLEARPLPEAFDTEALDAELKAFREDLTAAIDTAQAEIAEARAEADQIAESAEQAASEADRQKALVGLTAALETGEPFAGLLEGLVAEGLGPFPPALTDVADEGVATLQELRTEFAPVARAALDVSIRESSGDSAGDRLMSFLRVQTGARSLTPQEGDDPDAVLSRAEAKLGEGDLSAVLGEIETLPAAGQGGMADWVAAVQQRLDATEAVSALVAGETTN